MNYTRIVVVMVKASKGPRRRTRKKLRKNVRERGKLNVQKYLQVFSLGDKVVIKPDPAYQKALPHGRFIGRIGEIIGTRGKAYLVRIKDIKKEKTLIMPAVHLKKVI